MGDAAISLDLLSSFGLTSAIWSAALAAKRIKQWRRILVKRDFTREMADLLLADIAAALEHFRSHPITTNLSASEAATYNHL